MDSTQITTGFKKTAAWGTAEALGAGHGIQITSASIKRSDESLPDVNQGNAYPVASDRGLITCEGDLSMFLRYDVVDQFLAHVHGSAGAPTQQGTSAAYAFSYAWTNVVDGIFGCLARKMSSYIEEYSSVKAVGYTIKGQEGKPLELVLKMIAIDKIVDSAVNTTVSFANVTIPYVGHRIMFSHGVFRMNDQAGAALGSGDVISPSAYEISVMRKLKGLPGTFRTAAPKCVQDLIDEPTNDGHPEFSAKLTFPRHTTKTRLEDLGKDTRKKADLTFTGAIIESTYARSLKWEFPHAQIKSVDITDKEGNIEEPMDLVLLGAATAPTGMAITTPIHVSGVNQRSTNPLA